MPQTRLSESSVESRFNPAEIRSSIRLMSFSRSKALTRILPFLVPLELAQGMIDFERNIPVADVTLVATGNRVLVRSDLHPEIINLLTQTLLEAHREAGLFQQYGEFPTVTDPEFPMAESARDFYKNGPPLLNKYLPFWMVPHVQRYSPCWWRPEQLFFRFSVLRRNSSHRS